MDCAEFSFSSLPFSHISPLVIDDDIVNKRNQRREKDKKEERFVSDFVFFFFPDEEEEGAQIALFDMGCLFSYFFRASASADIVETPRQAFSWYDRHLLMPCISITHPARVSGSERIARQSRKKTTFLISSKIRPSIDYPAPSMASNSSVG
jgi:hypothetical protein